MLGDMIFNIEIEIVVSVLGLGQEGVVKICRHYLFLSIEINAHCIFE